MSTSGRDSPVLPVRGEYILSQFNTCNEQVRQNMLTNSNVMDTAINATTYDVFRMVVEGGREVQTCCAAACRFVRLPRLTDVLSDVRVANFL